MKNYSQEAQKIERPEQSYADFNMQHIPYLVTPNGVTPLRYAEDVDLINKLFEKQSEIEEKNKELQRLVHQLMEESLGD